MRSAGIVCLFSLFVASVASDCGGDASCMTEKEKDGAALLQSGIQLHGGAAEQEAAKENKEAAAAEEEEEEEGGGEELIEEKDVEAGYWLDLKSKQAAASSGNAAQRAIDGNSNTDYGGGSCTHTDKDNKAWWEVNLGSSYTISNVEVTNRGGSSGSRLNGFSVLVDGESCASSIAISQGETKQVSCSATGQRIRVQLPDTEYLTICEFRVFVATEAAQRCPSPAGKASKCADKGGGGSGYNVATCDSKMLELGGDTFNYKDGACYVKLCGKANMKYNDQSGEHEVYSTYCKACTHVIASGIGTEIACTTSGCQWVSGKCEASTCSNNPTPTMMKNGETCESAGETSDGTHCQYNEFWKKNKFCQRACFENGAGYHGDYCQVLFQPKYPIGTKCTDDLIKTFTKKPDAHRRRSGPNAYHTNADGTDKYAYGYSGGCACRRRSSYDGMEKGWMCDVGGKYHKNVAVYVPQCFFPKVTNSATKACDVWAAYNDGAIPAGMNCRTRCKHGYAPSHEMLLCNFGNLWPPTFTCTACADFSPSQCTANECEINGWGVCQAAFCSEFTSKSKCNSEASKCKWHDATRTCQVKQLNCETHSSSNCPDKYNCEVRDGNCKEVVADVSAPTSCDAGKYLVDFLIDADNCVEDCPPGFFKTAHTNGNSGGTCTECDGIISGTTCNPCPAGEISVTGANHCQNIQASCKPDQCGPCLTCMGNVAEDLQSCVKDKGCFHPGTTWCSSSIEALVDCQSESLGCWYKVMCEAECVCDAWKAVKCGGKTKKLPCFSHLELGQMNTSTKLEDKSKQRRQKGSEEEDAVSLDEALSGKRGEPAPRC